MEKLVRIKSYVILGVMVFVCAVFTYYIMLKAGTVKNIDTATDEMRETTIYELSRDKTMEGTIYDRSGIAISKADTYGDTGTLSDVAYSYLIGYNSKNYGTYGIKGLYKDYLWLHDEKKEFDDGADIEMTIRDDLQCQIYRMIEGRDAAVMVMDYRTGEILALVSSNKMMPFDANQIEDKYTDYAKIDGFFLSNAYRDNQPPGSVFKIVTATAAIETGNDAFCCVDGGSVTIQGVRIRNAGGAVYGDLDLQNALIHSSNVYFSQLALKIGSENLQNVAEKFCLNQEIKLDFTKLSSNYDMTLNEDENEEVLLAMTGFGQGHTTISLVQLGMIMAAIANDGEMKEPHVIKNIKKNEEILYQYEDNTLVTPVSKETADKVKILLKGVAQSYGFSSEMMAKTGTAELGKGNLAKAYLVTADNQYVVCISCKEEGIFGSNLRESVKGIYQKIYEEE